MTEQALGQQRSQCYLFFCTLLSQPMDTALWQQLCQWAEQVEEGGFMSPLLVWIKHRGQMTPDQLTKMSVDYTRLLGGIGQEYGPPPPYEHLYLNNQSATAKPLSPTDDSDHIVCQLQTLADSVKRIQSPPDASVLLQKRMTIWIALWKTQLEKQQCHYDFYPKVVTTLLEFLKQDIHYM